MVNWFDVHIDFSKLSKSYIICEFVWSSRWNRWSLCHTEESVDCPKVWHRGHHDVQEREVWYVLVFLHFRIVFLYHFFPVDKIFMTTCSVWCSLFGTICSWKILLTNFCLCTKCKENSILTCCYCKDTGFALNQSII